MQLREAANLFRRECRGSFHEPTQRDIERTVVAVLERATLGRSTSTSIDLSVRSENRLHANYYY